MEKLKQIKFQFYNLLLINLIIAVTITFASYVHIPFGDAKGLFFYGLHFVALQTTIFGFVYLLTVHKYIFNFLFPLLFIGFSLVSFWVYTQDITIDFGIIQIVLESKFDIAMDLISIPFILYLLWVLIATYGCLKAFEKIKISAVKSPLIILALSGIMLFFVGEKYKFGVFKRRLPYNIVTAVIKYLEKPAVTYKKAPTTVFSKTDSLHIVFVLGEAVRADHLSINGYKRNTTPLLQKRKNIISCPNVFTPFTYTAVSVPQILTNQSIKETLNNHTVLYDVLNKAAISTTWIGNQSLEKSYETIVKENRHVYLIDKLHSVLSFKKEQDGKLLQVFDTVKQNKCQFTTLQMIGSHWFYDSRYPADFKKFAPTAKSKFLKSSSSQQLINSYDNTILYLDWFLDSLITRLEKTQIPTLLIYLSDHGEVLGENGQWLHGQDNNACKNPALLIWSSKTFRDKYPKQIYALSLNKNKKISTDFLFNSILYIFDIQGFKYVEEDSIFTTQ